MEKKYNIKEVLEYFSILIKTLKLSIESVEEPPGFDNIIIILKSTLCSLKIVRHRGEISIFINLPLKNKNNNEKNWYDINLFLEYISLNGHPEIKLGLNEKELDEIKNLDFQKFQIRKNAFILNANSFIIKNFIKKKNICDVQVGLKDFLESKEKYFFEKVKKKQKI